MTSPHLQLTQLARPSKTPKVMIDLTVDGKSVSVPEGSTILNACQKLGIDIPIAHGL